MRWPIGSKLVGTPLGSAVRKGARPSLASARRSLWLIERKKSGGLNWPHNLGGPRIRRFFACAGSFPNSSAASLLSAFFRRFFPLPRYVELVSTDCSYLIFSDGGGSK